jgi:hypothetical protein
VIRESGCVKQRRGDVGGLKERVVGKYFLVRSAGGKQFQQINNAETRSPDAGSAATLVRVNCNAIKRFHGEILSGCQPTFQHRLFNRPTVFFQRN